jgi:hypothetical protein
MDANATCPVAQPGTGTIRTWGLRGLAQVTRPGSATRWSKARRSAQIDPWLSPMATCPGPPAGRLSPASAGGPGPAGVLGSFTSRLPGLRLQPRNRHLWSWTRGSTGIWPGEAGGRQPRPARAATMNRAAAASRRRHHPLRVMRHPPRPGGYWQRRERVIIGCVCLTGGGSAGTVHGCSRPGAGAAVWCPEAGRKAPPDYPCPQVLSAIAAGGRRAVGCWPGAGLSSGRRAGPAGDAGRDAHQRRPRPGGGRRVPR